MIVKFFPEVEAYEKAATAPSESINLDRVGVIILGGGIGERLKPLTLSRCKPVISFAGRYSLVDIPISHSLNSGLKKIYVIGQYLSTTLQNHLYQTYLHHGIEAQQIQMIIPEEKEGKKTHYQGTADAIRQNVELFSGADVDYFLILSGDQLYNMDFRELIDYGFKSNADMVIAAQPIDTKNAKRMGVLKMDYASQRLLDFYEKPQEEETLQKYAIDPSLWSSFLDQTPSDKSHIGSLGIYFFKRQSLFDLLVQDDREDFGKHLIKTQMDQGKVQVYLYEGYWEDIGTIESYYHANLALTKEEGDLKRVLECYDESHKILTHSNNLPGPKILNCRIHQSIICEGSVIEAEEISNSVIGLRSVIKKGTIIRDSVLMGNEYYERPPLSSGQRAPKPLIGENCFIKKAIIDQNVTFGNHVKLINQKSYLHYDPPEGQPPLYVRDGIIIIPKGTSLPQGFIF